MDNAKAIKAYRRRRIQRLRARYDVEEEENNNNGGGKAGGHGNTRIPFGLCQREGITVDPKWTPHDAWEALEGKGYSAKESYSELRRTGKVGKKSGTASAAKTKSQKMQTAGLPSAMRSGSGSKKLAAFDSEFQKLEMEDHISDFVANAGAVMGENQIRDFDLQKTRPGAGDQLKTWRNVFSGEIVKARLSVPDLSKVPEEFRNGEASTFAHELVHYMNLCQRPDKSYGNFTDGDEDLTKAVTNARDKAHKEGFNPEIRQYLKETGDLWRKKRDEYNDETKRIAKELESKWMARTEELGTPGKLPPEEYKAYKKERDAIVNQRKEEYDWIRDSFHDGATALSNMYDALTFGRLGDEKISWYRHGRSYYGGDANKVKNEMLSIYVELHMAKNKNFLKMFRNDQPELANALDNTIRKMLKNGKVEGYS